MEILTWAIKLINSSISLNLPNIVTLLAAVFSGLVGSYIVGMFSKKLGISIVGNILAAIIGGIAGSYLFLFNVFNLIPLETSLINFDNDINLDMLVGLIVGGILGGIVLKIILGTMRSILFSPKESAT